MNLFDLNNNGIPDYKDLWNFGGDLLDPRSDFNSSIRDAGTGIFYALGETAGKSAGGVLSGALKGVGVGNLLLVGGALALAYSVMKK